LIVAAVLFTITLVDLLPQDDNGRFAVFSGIRVSIPLFPAPFLLGFSGIFFGASYFFWWKHAQKRQQENRPILPPSPESRARHINSALAIYRDIRKRESDDGYCRLSKSVTGSIHRSFRTIETWTISETRLERQIVRLVKNVNQIQAPPGILARLVGGRADRVGSTPIPIGLYLARKGVLAEGISTRIDGETVQILDRHSNAALSLWVFAGMLAALTAEISGESLEAQERMKRAMRSLAPLILDPMPTTTARYPTAGETEPATGRDRVVEVLKELVGASELKKEGGQRLLGVVLELCDKHYVFARYAPVDRELVEVERNVVEPFHPVGGRLATLPRRASGLPIHRLTIPLDEAQWSRSYHLRANVPFGMYLAHGGFWCKPEDRDLKEAKLSGTMGSDFIHAYVNSRLPGDHHRLLGMQARVGQMMKIGLDFRARPPGVAGIALLVGLYSAILALLFWQVDALSEPSANTAVVEVQAIAVGLFFAIPLGLASWLVGFAYSQHRASLTPSVLSELFGVWIGSFLLGLAALLSMLDVKWRWLIFGDPVMNYLRLGAVAVALVSVVVTGVDLVAVRFRRYHWAVQQGRILRGIDNDLLNRP
jgi:hypothetical protein